MWAFRFLRNFHSSFARFHVHHVARDQKVSARWKSLVEGLLLRRLEAVAHSGIRTLPQPRPRSIPLRTDKDRKWLRLVPRYFDSRFHNGHTNGLYLLQDSGWNCHQAWYRGKYMAHQVTYLNWIGAKKWRLHCKGRACRWWWYRPRWLRRFKDLVYTTSSLVHDLAYSQNLCFLRPVRILQAFVPIWRWCPRCFPWEPEDRTDRSHDLHPFHIQFSDVLDPGRFPEGWQALGRP